jgi:hypothetical protein
MTKQDTPRPRANMIHRQRRDDPPVVPLRTVEALLREHPRLHIFGYGPHPAIEIEPGAYTELVSPGSRVRIAAARSWLESRLVPAPRNSKRARSTYTLKHQMARETGQYIYSGEMAAAALLSHISVDTSYFNPLLYAVFNPDTTPTGDRERGKTNNTR